MPYATSHRSNKHMLIGLIIAISLLSFNHSYAYDLTGTWKLTSFKSYIAKNSQPYNCYSPTGLLIYTNTGYMAVGFNCMVAKQSQNPNYDPSKMTFYMGKYSLNGDIVTHSVMNASDPAYYDKNLQRTIKFIDNNHLLFIATDSKGNEYKLIWQRVEK